MLNKRFLIFFLVLLTLILLTIPVNRFIRETLPTEKKPIGLKNEMPFSDNAQTSSRDTEHRVSPDKPQRFGILVQTPADEPRSELQWDSWMKKTLNPSHKKEERTPEEISKERTFKNKMRDISNRIKYYESQRNQRPGDTAIEEKLKRLYRLRAVLGVLKQ